MFTISKPRKKLLRETGIWTSRVATSLRISPGIMKRCRGNTRRGSATGLGMWACSRLGRRSVPKTGRWASASSASDHYLPIIGHLSKATSFIRVIFLLYLGHQLEPHLIFIRKGLLLFLTLPFVIFCLLFRLLLDYFLLPLSLLLFVVALLGHFGVELLLLYNVFLFELLVLLQ